MHRGMERANLGPALNTDCGPRVEHREHYWVLTFFLNADEGLKKYARERGFDKEALL